MSRGRIRRSLTFLMLRERAPAVLVAALLLALAGWFMVRHWDRGMNRCLARYAQARTAEDTARVDRIGWNIRNRRGCGEARRDGTLDRHRQAMERRAAAAGDPLIEK